MECVFVGIVLIPVTFIAIGIALQMAKARAKREYLACLEELRRNPGNATMREETLALGHRYIAKINMGLTEGTRPAGAFSELTLMNDINAACARANNPRA